MPWPLSPVAQLLSSEKETDYSDFPEGHNRSQQKQVERLTLRKALVLPWPLA